MADVKRRVEEFRECFEVGSDCPQEELERSSRTSVALDRLAEKHRLGSLAYYYQGTGNEDNEEAVRSIILGTSLLTPRGAPGAGASGVQNAQAVKSLHSFRVRASFRH